jgi:hypothetical protein
LKTYKHFAVFALLLLSACFCFVQSGSTAPATPSTALSVIGTPDDPDIARQIFPDAKPDDLFIAAGNANETVRIGLREYRSTLDVTRDGVNVRGVLSVDGIPITVAAKAPTGACTEPALILMATD